MIGYFTTQILYNYKLYLNFEDYESEQFVLKCLPGFLVLFVFL
jgi:hypothetical protein